MYFTRIEQPSMMAIKITNSSFLVFSSHIPCTILIGCGRDLMRTHIQHLHIYAHVLFYSVIRLFAWFYCHVAHKRDFRTNALSKISQYLICLIFNCELWQFPTSYIHSLLSICSNPVASSLVPLFLSFLFSFSFLFILFEHTEIIQISLFTFRSTKNML